MEFQRDQVTVRVPEEPEITAQKARCGQAARGRVALSTLHLLSGKVSKQAAQEEAQRSGRLRRVGPASRDPACGPAGLQLAFLSSASSSKGERAERTHPPGLPLGTEARPPPSAAL